MNNTEQISKAFRANVKDLDVENEYQANPDYNNTDRKLFYTHFNTDLLRRVIEAKINPKKRKLWRCNC